jgi:YidC/Oxa1 family membrane protein insertase
MFALYQVIYNIPAYVDKVYDLYAGIAGVVQTKGGSNYPDLLTTIVDAIKGFRGAKDFNSINGIVDVLKQFNSGAWNTFTSSFTHIKDAVAVTLGNGHTLSVADTIGKLQGINSFFGFNIADKPGYGFPGILIPIFAGALQFVQGKQLQVKNKEANKDNPASSAMNSMNVVMPIMTIFFCVAFPIGIGIYWIASSVFAIIQQYFVNKYMDKVDLDELIKKNVAKAGKRSAYLESKGISMADLAKKQTKYIESAADKDNAADNSNDTGEAEVSSSNTSQSSNGAKSISDIANLLKNRNEKGDK